MTNKMTLTITLRGWQRRAARAVLAMLCVCASCRSGQAQAMKPVVQAQAQIPGTEVDRVVAIVNGEPVLDSDVDEEQRMEQLSLVELGGVTGTAVDRDRLIERVIDLRLILQQIHGQPEFDVSDAAVDKEIGDVKRSIPACAAGKCATEAQWTAFLAAKGFTEAEFRERWTERMQVLAFTEQRFRAGIKISPEQVATYYSATLVPQYKKLHDPVPPLDTVKERIEGVLLEKQVSSLLDDWLKSLRAQGGVVVVHPGEPTP